MPLGRGRGSSGGPEETTGRRTEMDYNHVVVRIGEVVDAAGVAIIVAGAAFATGTAAVRFARREAGTYRGFRRQLGRTILLGLELLVAGDIVRTVAAQPTVASVAILGLI